MRAIAAMALTLLATPAAAQQDVPRKWELRAIAETYRAGNTDAALEMLAADNTDIQQRVAKAVASSHRIGKPPAPGDPSPTWTIGLLRAAGAVHMEQAFALYKRGGRDLVARVVTQIQIGEILLDEVANVETRPSDAAKWEWAIGQRAMADGAFQPARSILLRACDRYPRDYPLLLLTCGSLHETFASLHTDTTGALRSIRSMNVSSSQNTATSVLLGFRSNRSNNLSLAAAAFTNVRELDPANVEAAVRLGQVRLQQKDPQGAAAALEPLLRVTGDQRLMYLSRLFLGRTRERQDRPEDAIALFRAALAVLPAQAARLSLANRLHAIGSNDEARLLADAVANERDLEDPWWSYRFGQYWLLDATLAALREEARR